MEVVSTTAPQYPELAVRVRITGNVLIEVSIDSAGEVVAARIIEGHALLRDAAQMAALRWRFTPALGSTTLRSARLNFGFKMARGDKEQVEVNSQFIPPYQMEVTYKIPKDPEILRLPRVSSAIERNVCPVHRNVLQIDIVPIIYGLFMPNKKYSKAMRRFPEAHTAYLGGCVIRDTQKAEVLYCPKCRVAEEEWLRKHQKQRPAPVAAVKP